MINEIIGTAIPVLAAITGIMFALLLLDWISNNWKKPFFTILVIVLILHVIIIFNLPASWILEDATPPPLDVSIMPEEDGWAGMLMEQDEGIEENFLYVECADQSIL